jgi:transcriptional regulator with XRE-family HTH domain
MTAEEARAAREALGLTTAQLARELLIDERNISAWEKGDIQLPRSVARELAWRAAIARQQSALQQSGLPECEWVRAWEAASLSGTGTGTGTGKDFKKHLAELQQHAAACPVCQAREDYARARLPPLPAPPLPPFADVVARFNAQVHKLPPWARPVAYGTALLGTVLIIRLLLMLVGG